MPDTTTNQYEAVLPEKLRANADQKRYLVILHEEAKRLGVALASLAFYGSDLDDPINPVVEAVFSSKNPTAKVPDWEVLGWQQISPLIAMYKDRNAKARKEQGIAAPASAAPVKRFRLDAKSGQMVPVTD